MPIRPLRDQTSDFDQLCHQLQGDEVLLGRAENHRLQKPNAGAILTTEALFGLFVRTAESAGVEVIFFAIPASELPPQSRPGPGRRPRRS
jgi:hypothetical protein